MYETLYIFLFDYSLTIRGERNNVISTNNISKNF